MAIICSVFMEGPFLTCGTSGSTVSCSSPPNLEKAIGVVGLYPFMKHGLINIKSGSKSGYSFTAKSRVPFVMEINKRWCSVTSHFIAQHQNRRAFKIE